MRRRLLFVSILLIAFIASAIGIPAPTVRADDLADASQTAWELSVLESQSNWSALYDRMHPDSQRIVDRNTMAYWYATYFAPQGPNPAQITGARLVDWTWPVTGQYYPGTAEISFIQYFNNGAVANDVVRLVRTPSGAWAWFFGRSLEFVYQMQYEASQHPPVIQPPQNTPIPQNTPVPQNTGPARTTTNLTLPPAAFFADALTAIDRVAPDCFVATGAATFPETVGRDTISTRYSNDFDDIHQEASHYFDPNDRQFPDLIALVRTLPPSDTPETTAQKLLADQIDWNGPPYSAPPRALALDLAPKSAYLINYYEESNEALGWVSVLTWGPRNSHTLFAITGPGTDLYDELLATWTTNILASCAIS